VVFSPGFWVYPKEVAVEDSLLWGDLCLGMMWFEGMDDIEISSEQTTR
jgi:hypothetical protein